MIPNDLLMNDQKSKWLILQYLSLNRGDKLTVDQLCTQFQMSKYKIERNLEELVVDLEKAVERKVIFLSSTGEIHCSNLSPLIIKKAYSYMFLSSDIFKIFHDILIREERIENQIIDYSMSRSSAYKIRRQIKVLLLREKLGFIGNQFVGDEFRLRSFAFGLYYDIFNGISNPFPKEVQQLCKDILKKLTHSQIISMKKTQEMRLNFFICIWLIRMKNGHFVDKTFATVEVESDRQALVRLLNSWLDYKADEKNLVREIDYLFLFLELEGIMIGKKMCFIDNEINDLTASLTDRFLEYFNGLYELETIDFRNNEKVRQDVHTIHQKLMLYRPREFVDDKITKEKLLDVIHPEIDRHLKIFIQQNEYITGHLRLDEQNRLYYDYLFFLLYWIPRDNFELSLYICVDFSFGQYYNHHIQAVLSSTPGIFVRFEDRLTAKTDLYLSDFAMDKLPCKQVIWERTPTTEDWSSLTEQLYLIKEEKHGER